MYIHLGINYKWIKSVRVSNHYLVIKIVLLHSTKLYNYIHCLIIVQC